MNIFIMRIILIALIGASDSLVSMMIALAAFYKGLFSKGSECRSLFLTLVLMMLSSSVWAGGDLLKGMSKVRQVYYLPLHDASTDSAEEIGASPPKKLPKSIKLTNIVDSLIKVGRRAGEVYTRHVSELRWTQGAEFLGLPISDTVMSTDVQLVISSMRRNEEHKFDYLKGQGKAYIPLYSRVNPTSHKLPLMFAYPVGKVIDDEFLPRLQNITSRVIVFDHPVAKRSIEGVLLGAWEVIVSRNRDENDEEIHTMRQLHRDVATFRHGVFQNERGAELEELDYIHADFMIIHPLEKSGMVPKGASENPQKKKKYIITAVRIQPHEQGMDSEGMMQLRYDFEVVRFSIESTVTFLKYCNNERFYVADNEESVHIYASPLHIEDSKVVRVQVGVPDKIIQHKFPVLTFAPPEEDYLNKIDVSQLSFNSSITALISNDSVNLGLVSREISSPIEGWDDKLETTAGREARGHSSLRAGADTPTIGFYSARKNTSKSKSRPSSRKSFKTYSLPSLKETVSEQTHVSSKEGSGTQLSLLKRPPIKEDSDSHMNTLPEENNDLYELVEIMKLEPKHLPQQQGSKINRARSPSNLSALSLSFLNPPTTSSDHLRSQSKPLSTVGLQSQNKSVFDMTSSLSSLSLDTRKQRQEEPLPQVITATTGWDPTPHSEEEYDQFNFSESPASTMKTKDAGRKIKGAPAFDKLYSQIISTSWMEGLQGMLPNTNESREYADTIGEDFATSALSGNFDDLLSEMVELLATYMGNGIFDFISHCVSIECVDSNIQRRVLNLKVMKKAQVRDFFCEDLALFLLSDVSNNQLYYKAHPIAGIAMFLCDNKLYDKFNDEAKKYKQKAEGQPDE